MTLKKPLLKQLVNDFPQFKFVESDDFYYNSTSKTIYYNSQDQDFGLLLLHELSHALLGHEDYKFDIELVRMEVDAWRYTLDNLANRYNISTKQKLVEAVLETYRDWLYERSCCPRCQSVGYQRSDASYACLECGTKWRANMAKFTSLKRRRI